MSEYEIRPEFTQRACNLVWCATPHRDTMHPDDEAHRSVGRGFLARVRGARETGPGVWRDVEVGVLRRPDDVEGWLIIETADGAGLALSLDGARELRRALVDDPDVQQALSS